MDKKKFKGTVVTILFAIVGGMIGSQIVRTLNQQDFDTVLMEISNEINKNLPMMIDENTRVDSTLGGPGNKITYFYTLVNHSAQDIDIETLKPTLKKQLINNYKSSSGMKDLRENDVELQYIYRDNQAVELMKFIVTTSDF